MDVKATNALVERFQALKSRHERGEKRRRCALWVGLAGIVVAVAVDLWARALLNAQPGSTARTLRNIVGLAALALAIVCGVAVQRTDRENAKLRDEMNEINTQIEALNRPSGGGWKPRAQRMRGGGEDV